MLLIPTKQGVVPTSEGCIPTSEGVILTKQGKIRENRPSFCAVQHVPNTKFAPKCAFCHKNALFWQLLGYLLLPNLYMHRKSCWLLEMPIFLRRAKRVATVEKGELPATNNQKPATLLLWTVGPKSSVGVDGQRRIQKNTSLRTAGVSSAAQENARRMSAAGEEMLLDLHHCTIGPVVISCDNLLGAPHASNAIE